MCDNSLMALRFARLLACLALVAALSVPAPAQEETPPVQRHLAELYLGDSLDDVRLVYPPAQEWPSSRERGGIRRLRVEREYAKSLPPEIETLWLGFKRDRLVEVQVVYTIAYSRKKSAEQLAGDFSLVYGEPRRSNDKFWWADGSTVLRVFNAHIPAGAEGSVEMRTSAQILERGLFRRAD